VSFFTDSTWTSDTLELLIGSKRSPNVIAFLTRAAAAAALHQIVTEHGDVRLPDSTVHHADN